MKTPMSKAWTPKAPLLTPEALQALSTQEFASVRELIEAEDQRRITATPLTYVTPGPRILTPEGAAECAREGGLSARSEWLVALFMSNRHEVLARYRIYVGHSCPLPRELALDMDAVFKTAKACQAERIMLVRHHAHPLMLPPSRS
jgi:DNA repair protein RadC